MNLTPLQVVLGFAGLIAYFFVLYFVHKSLAGRAAAYFRYGAVLGTAAIFFYLMQEKVADHAYAVNYIKLGLAVTAAMCVMYESYRKGQARPIAEKWKKFVGIALAVAAISCYFNGFKFGYPKYYHRWDQYHYYMGAKYFPELRYTELYKCGVVAEDQLGVVKFTPDKRWDEKKEPRANFVNMAKEMRDPDKKVRDLGGDNLLIPVREILANPEQCEGKFTPERWEEYKNDVKFFRIVSGKGYWTDMQKDHGYNPPPVWTLGGKFFSDLSPTNVQFMQFLASLDLLYLVGMFVALWWAFGWRVFAVGAIFWGCQSSAPFYWTGGAFLRQDWLFFLVLSAACLRKRHFKIAGAALVYAGLLRIFPGLVVIGTLVPFIVHIIKKKKVQRDHLQMLIGGTAAAAVLIGLSLWMTDKNAYQDFYHHTLQTHDKTPLTNHMGLRVMIGHKYTNVQVPGLRNQEEAAERAGLCEYISDPTQKKTCVDAAPGWKAALYRIKWPIEPSYGPPSGQMEYVKDNKLVDPFQTWKDLRNERNHDLKWLSYAILAATLAFFVMVVRRTKSLWIAQCLGQIFIILLSQLTCYYYSFMILAAPLTKARKQIEVGMFALATVTQLIWVFRALGQFNDNKYTALTYASLIFCYVMIGLFWHRKQRDSEQAEDAPSGTTNDDNEDEDEDEDEDETAPQPA